MYLFGITLTALGALTLLACAAWFIPTTIIPILARERNKVQIIRPILLTVIALAIGLGGLLIANTAADVPGKRHD